MEEIIRTADEIRRALWHYGFAYGNPPRLWRVSPKWYYLWEQQWQQALALGQLLPKLRAAVDSSDEATYLRADFTLDRRGYLVLLELNGTPVWDLATQLVRETYYRSVGLPEGSFDPFPGAAKTIAGLLLKKFSGRRLVILLSPDRLGYGAEYRLLARYLQSFGLCCEVSETGESLLEGDVVYRTFTLAWLQPQSAKVFPGGQRLGELLSGGKLDIWPPFTRLEDNSWMVAVHNPETASGRSFALSSSDRQSLKGFIPWTFPVVPEVKIPFKGRGYSWGAEEFMGRRLDNSGKETLQWVLKRCNGGQGKGIAFSSQLTAIEWRNRLLGALFPVANGDGPLYVIQPEVPTLEHKVVFLNEAGEGLVEADGYRVRLCVVYLVEGDSVEVADIDATLLDRPLVHGSSDAVAMPVIVRKKK